MLFVYFIYILCCCILVYLYIPLSFILIVFIFVASVYHFNVKQCYTVSIFVTKFLTFWISINNSHNGLVFLNKIPWISKFWKDVVRLLYCSSSLVGKVLLGVISRFKPQVRYQNGNISSATSFQQISGKNFEMKVFQKFVVRNLL